MKIKAVVRSGLWSLVPKQCTRQTHPLGVGCGPQYPGSVSDQYVPWSPALVVEKTPTNLAPSYAEKLNAGYAQLASLLSSL